MWYSMDEPWKHYIKQNKSDKKEQILYDSTSVRDLENKIHTESKQWLLGGGGRRNGKFLFNG